MLLGIDYGLKNIGLAISDGEIAEPKETLKITDVKDGLKEIEKRVGKWGIEKIIIGVSEGKSKNRALGFGKKIQTVLRLPVEYIDETLTTVEAQSQSRKHKEHAVAAAIILQRYLDSSS